MQDKDGYYLRDKFFAEFLKYASFTFDGLLLSALNYAILFAKYSNLENDTLIRIGFAVSALSFVAVIPVINSELPDDYKKYLIGLSLLIAGGCAACAVLTNKGNQLNLVAGLTGSIYFTFTLLVGIFALHRWKNYRAHVNVATIYRETPIDALISEHNAAFSIVKNKYVNDFEYFNNETSIGHLLSKLELIKEGLPRKIDAWLQEGHRYQGMLNSNETINDNFVENVHRFFNKTKHLIKTDSQSEQSPMRAPDKRPLLQPL